MFFRDGVGHKEELSLFQRGVLPLQTLKDVRIRKEVNRR